MFDYDEGALAGAAKMVIDDACTLYDRIWQMDGNFGFEYHHKGEASRRAAVGRALDLFGALIERHHRPVFSTLCEELRSFEERGRTQTTENDDNLAREAILRSIVSPLLDNMDYRRQAAVAVNAVGDYIVISAIAAVGGCLLRVDPRVGGAHVYLRAKNTLAKLDKDTTTSTSATGSVGGGLDATEAVAKSCFLACLFSSLAARGVPCSFSKLEQSQYSHPISALGPRTVAGDMGGSQEDGDRNIPLIAPRYLPSSEEINRLVVSRMLYSGLGRLHTSSESVGSGGQPSSVITEMLADVLATFPLGELLSAPLVLKYGLGPLLSDHCGTSLQNASQRLVVLTASLIAVCKVEYSSVGSDVVTFRDPLGLVEALWFSPWRAAVASPEHFLTRRAISTVAVSTAPIQEGIEGRLLRLVETLTSTIATLRPPSVAQALKSDTFSVHLGETYSDSHILLPNDSHTFDLTAPSPAAPPYCPVHHSTLGLPNHIEDTRVAIVERIRRERACTCDVQHHAVREHWLQFMSDTVARELAMRTVMVAISVEARGLKTCSFHALAPAVRYQAMMQLCRGALFVVFAIAGGGQSSSAVGRGPAILRSLAVTARLWCGKGQQRHFTADSPIQMDRHVTSDDEMAYPFVSYLGDSVAAFRSVTVSHGPVVGPLAVQLWTLSQSHDAFTSTPTMPYQKVLKKDTESEKSHGFNVIMISLSQDLVDAAPFLGFVARRVLPAVFAAFVSPTNRGGSKRVVIAEEGLPYASTSIGSGEPVELTGPTVFTVSSATPVISVGRTAAPSLATSRTFGAPHSQEILESTLRGETTREDEWAVPTDLSTSNKDEVTHSSAPYTTFPDGPQIVCVNGAYFLEGRRLTTSERLMYERRSRLMKQGKIVTPYRRPAKVPPTITKSAPPSSTSTTMNVEALANFPAGGLRTISDLIPASETPPPATDFIAGASAPAAATPLDGAHRDSMYASGDLHPSSSSTTSTTYNNTTSSILVNSRSSFQSTGRRPSLGVGGEKGAEVGEQKSPQSPGILSLHSSHGGFESLGRRGPDPHGSSLESDGAGYLMRDEREDTQVKNSSIINSHSVLEGIINNVGSVVPPSSATTTRVSPNGKHTFLMSEHVVPVPRSILPTGSPKTLDDILSEGDLHQTSPSPSALELLPHPLSRSHNTDTVHQQQTTAGNGQLLYAHTSPRPGDMTSIFAPELIVSPVADEFSGIVVSAGSSSCEDPRAVDGSGDGGPPPGGNHLLGANPNWNMLSVTTNDRSLNASSSTIAPPPDNGGGDTHREHRDDVDDTHYDREADEEKNRGASPPTAYAFEDDVVAGGDGEPLGASGKSSTRSVSPSSSPHSPDGVASRGNSGELNITCTRNSDDDPVTLASSEASRRQTISPSMHNLLPSSHATSPRSAQEEEDGYGGSFSYSEKCSEPMPSDDGNGGGGDSTSVPPPMLSVLPQKRGSTQKTSVGGGVLSSSMKEAQQPQRVPGRVSITSVVGVPDPQSTGSSPRYSTNRVASQPASNHNLRMSISSTGGDEKGGTMSTAISFLSDARSDSQRDEGGAIVPVRLGHDSSESSDPTALVHFTPILANVPTQQATPVSHLSNNNTPSPDEEDFMTRVRKYNEKQKQQNRANKHAFSRKNMSDLHAGRGRMMAGGGGGGLAAQVPSRDTSQSQHPAHFVRGIDGGEDRLQVSLNSLLPGWREESLSMVKDGRSPSPVADLNAKRGTPQFHGNLITVLQQASITSTIASPRAVSPNMKSVAPLGAMVVHAKLAAEKADVTRMIGRVRVSFLVPSRLLLPELDLPRLEQVAHHLSGHVNRATPATVFSHSNASKFTLPTREFVLAGICTAWAVDESRRSCTAAPDEDSDPPSPRRGERPPSPLFSEAERLASLLGFLSALSSISKDALLRHMTSEHGSSLLSLLSSTWTAGGGEQDGHLVVPSIPMSSGMSEVVKYLLGLLSNYYVHVTAAKRAHDLTPDDKYALLQDARFVPEEEDGDMDGNNKTSTAPPTPLHQSFQQSFSFNLSGGRRRSSMNPHAQLPQFTAMHTSGAESEIGSREASQTTYGNTSHSHPLDNSVKAAVPTKKIGIPLGQFLKSFLATATNFAVDAGTGSSAAATTPPLPMGLLLPPLSSPTPVSLSGTNTTMHSTSTNASDRPMVALKGKPKVTSKSSNFPARDRLREVTCLFPMSPSTIFPQEVELQQRHKRLCAVLNGISMVLSSHTKWRAPYSTTKAVSISEPRSNVDFGDKRGGLEAATNRRIQEQQQHRNVAAAVSLESYLQRDARITISSLSPAHEESPQDANEWDMSHAVYGEDVRSLPTGRDCQHRILKELDNWHRFYSMHESVEDNRDGEVDEEEANMDMYALRPSESVVSPNTSYSIQAAKKCMNPSFALSTFLSRQRNRYALGNSGGHTQLGASSISAGRKSSLVSLSRVSLLSSTQMFGTSSTDRRLPISAHLRDLKESAFEFSANVASLCAIAANGDTLLPDDVADGAELPASVVAARSSGVHLVDPVGLRRAAAELLYTWKSLERDAYQAGKGVSRAVGDLWERQVVHLCDSIFCEALLILFYGLRSASTSPHNWGKLSRSDAIRAELCVNAISVCPTGGDTLRYLKPSLEACIRFLMEGSMSTTTTTPEASSGRLGALFATRAPTSSDVEKPPRQAETLGYLSEPQISRIAQELLDSPDQTSSAMWRYCLEAFAGHLLNVLAGNGDAATVHPDVSITSSHRTLAVRALREEEKKKNAMDFPSGYSSSSASNAAVSGVYENGSTGGLSRPQVSSLSTTIRCGASAKDDAIAPVEDHLGVVEGAGGSQGCLLRFQFTHEECLTLTPIIHRVVNDVLCLNRAVAMGPKSALLSESAKSWLVRTSLVVGVLDAIL